MTSTQDTHETKSLDMNTFGKSKSIDRTITTLSSLSHRHRLVTWRLRYSAIYDEENQHLVAMAAGVVDS